jgi:hypothetical protein
MMSLQEDAKIGGDTVALVQTKERVSTHTDNSEITDAVCLHMVCQFPDLNVSKKRFAIRSADTLMFNGWIPV